MAQKTILYWRDIPAQVIVKKGRKSAKRELSQRFTIAIDACAMHIGAKDSDAYLAEWRKSTPVECSDNLEHEAQITADQLEKQFNQTALQTLVKNDGLAGNMDRE